MSASASLRASTRIFTDGACRGNPGPGGWAAVLQYMIDDPGGERRPAEKILRGAEPRTTNNRMELMAAIAGLEALTRPTVVELTTDSEYVRKGITQWVAGWKRRNWTRAGNKPVLNRDLWERLDALDARHDVTWRWVKGHSGHAGNEAADRAANAAIDDLLKNRKAASGGEQ